MSYRTNSKVQPDEVYPVTLMPQIVSRGWIRCLPVEAGSMLLIVATVSALSLKGKEMWDQIDILWGQAKDYRPSVHELRAIEDVQYAFVKAYGLDYERTVRGVVDLLIRLGLVIQYEDDGEEVLDIPDILPLARV